MFVVEGNERVFMKDLKLSSRISGPSIVLYIDSFWRHSSIQ